MSRWKLKAKGRSSSSRRQTRSDPAGLLKTDKARQLRIKTRPTVQLTLLGLPWPPAPTIAPTDLSATYCWKSNDAGTRSSPSKNARQKRLIKPPLIKPLARSSTCTKEIRTKECKRSVPLAKRNVKSWKI